MPQWFIWVILVIIAIAIIWFFWNRSQESKAAAERAEAEGRRAASAAAARTVSRRLRLSLVPSESRHGYRMLQTPPWARTCHRRLPGSRQRLRIL